MLNEKQIERLEKLRQAMVSARVAFMGTPPGTDKAEQAQKKWTKAIKAYEDGKARVEPVAQK